MSSESVCLVARSWVDVGSFHTRLFGAVYFDIASVREFLHTPWYRNDSLSFSRFNTRLFLFSWFFLQRHSVIFWIYPRRLTIHCMHITKHYQFISADLVTSQFVFPQHTTETKLPSFLLLAICSVWTENGKPDPRSIVLSQASSTKKCRMPFMCTLLIWHICSSVFICCKLHESYVGGKERPLPIVRVTLSPVSNPRQSVTISCLENINME
jgi:hypothetical protein